MQLSLVFLFQFHIWLILAMNFLWSSFACPLKSWCSSNLLSFHTDTKERQNLFCEWRQCQKLGWTNSKVCMINFPNFILFDVSHHPSVFRYVEKCKFPKDGSSPKSLRYVGRYLGSCHYIFDLKRMLFLIKMLLNICF